MKSNNTELENFYSSQIRKVQKSEMEGNLKLRAKKSIPQAFASQYNHLQLQNRLIKSQTNHTRKDFKTCSKCEMLYTKVKKGDFEKFVKSRLKTTEAEPGQHRSYDDSIVMIGHLAETLLKHSMTKSAVWKLFKEKEENLQELQKH